MGASGSSLGAYRHPVSDVSNNYILCADWLNAGRITVKFSRDQNFTIHGSTKVCTLRFIPVC